MLAVFQERDQFDVDPTTAEIKPIYEDFLKVISEDVINFSDQTDLYWAIQGEPSWGQAPGSWKDERRQESLSR